MVLIKISLVQQLDTFLQNWYQMTAPYLKLHLHDIVWSRQRVQPHHQHIDLPVRFRGRNEYLTVGGRLPQAELISLHQQLTTPYNMSDPDHRYEYHIQKAYKGAQQFKEDFIKSQEYESVICVSTSIQQFNSFVHFQFSNKKV